MAATMSGVSVSDGPFQLPQSSEFSAYARAMKSSKARQRRATIPLSNKSFDAIGLSMGRGGPCVSTSRGAQNALDAGVAVSLVPTPPSARRGSFLYRSSDSITDLSPMSLSRKLSATSDAPQEDMIVTPFAQILQSLRSVRDNYVVITNVPPAVVTTRHNGQARDGPMSTTFEDDEQRVNGDSINDVAHDNEQQQQQQQRDGVTSTSHDQHGPTQTSVIDDQSVRLAVETLGELEWCLEQLEKMQTHRSVADMATNKFKKMLNRELNQFSESSKAGNEISEYICSTFLDTQEDLKLPIFNIEDADGGSSSRCSRRQSKQHVAVDGAVAAGATFDGNGDASGVGGGGVAGTAGTDAVSHVTASTAITLDVNLRAAAQLALLEPGPDEPHDPRLDECIDMLDVWGPDIFHIADATNSMPLTVIVYTILKDMDAIRVLKLVPSTVVIYLTLLEAHYSSGNPYHNSIHAADVTQSANVLLRRPALQSVFSELELVATIFASAVHDVDHPGVSSQYLINSSLELALMYNDQSVLENHHLAVAFKLLQEEGADIFQNLSLKSYQTLRRLVIDMVLATDMTKHMGLVADLKTMVETKRISGSGVLCLDNYADRSQVLKTLVHCADLSNPTKPLYIYRLWTDRIMEEFFRQGDMEREQGLEVSPMCDRTIASIEQSQVGFIDFIAHPLWETWSELVYPDCQDILDNIEANRDWFNARALAAAGTGAPSALSQDVVAEEENEVDSPQEEHNAAASSGCNCDGHTANRLTDES